MTWFAILGLFFLYSMAYKGLERITDRYFERRQDKQFIKRVRVMFPNADPIEVITVSSSNRQAIANVERRLRESSRSL